MDELETHSILLCRGGFTRGPGRKDDALTFNLPSADVGESGASDLVLGATDVLILGTEVDDVAVEPRTLTAPLNGGIGCINTPPFLGSGFGFAPEERTMLVLALGVFGFVGVTLRFWLSGASFAVAGGTMFRDGLFGVEERTECAPIALAVVDAASLEVFSRISFCFCSSFARMGTRSSGIGLFS